MRVVSVVLMTVMAGSILTARADPPASGTGPVYSVEALRAFELFGVHLGMTRAEVRKVAAAAGLASRFPQRARQRNATSDDFLVPSAHDPTSSRSFFGVQYDRWPGRELRVTALSYYTSFTPGEQPALDSRRTALLEKFGAPSAWRQWSNFERGSLYSASYVPLSSLVDERTRNEATSCMIGFACLDGQERADCRAKMKAARVPMMEVGLLPNTDYYTITDYEASYALLVRTPGFKRRPPVVVCPVPRVH